MGIWAATVRMSQGTTARPPVRSFGQPPPGYVAGLGRGAVGFTTRSDIGPAKVGPTREDRYAAVRGSSNAALVMSGLGPTPSREEDLSESNFDAFAGYGGSLFDASTPYDAEDREADNIYDAVDAKSVRAVSLGSCLTSGVQDGGAEGRLQSAARRRRPRGAAEEAAEAAGPVRRSETAAGNDQRRRMVEHS